MSFFGSDFFKKDHFKAEFYGRPFFYLNSFFDDTTIAHPQTGTAQNGEVTVNCNRIITGTPTTDAFRINVNGGDELILDIDAIGTALIFTLNTPLVGGEVVICDSYGEDGSNVGKKHGVGVAPMVATTKKTPAKKKAVKE